MSQAFPLMVAFALALGVLGAGLLALLLLQGRGKSQMQQRLLGSRDLAAEDFVEDRNRPLLAGLARRGRDLEKIIDTEGESAKLLVQAGWRSTTSRALWYAFQGSLPLFAVLFTVVLWVVRSGSIAPSRVILYGIMAVIVSILAPRYILRRAAETRRERIKGEVPLFVHLLVLLFEAGLSTRQAIASLVREGRGVLPRLGLEFELVLRQLEAGGDTGDVLRVMAETLDVSDLTGVIGVLRQVDRYGGEIREPLLDALSVLEERRSLDMREKVNALSGKMTVVMVLFFFPALLIFVGGPAVVSITRALSQVAK